MIAGTLNFAGMSTVAIEITRILVLIGMVLVAIHVVTGAPLGWYDRGLWGCPTVSGVMTWLQRQSVHGRTIR